MFNIDLKLDNWKKRLLDLGKRNRLINYRETKRSNLNITVPNYVDLFEKIVVDEQVLIFPYPVDKRFDEEDLIKSKTEIIKGDLETDRTIKEQQKTLKSLREKAKTAIEEQGVNILYLSFGFLKWYENTDSSQMIVSPIVLVPVTLTIESISDPYKMSLHEDEIVINPTLSHKLNNDRGLNLPEFDAQKDSIENYLMEISKLVKKEGFTIDTNVSLSLLSFLKINMYYDLDKHTEKIKNHNIIKALCRDNSSIEHVSETMNNYDHDNNQRPVDIYQVVDADSSQQDAVVLSKKGISFVLQGPPGTGKSQTITNIISEALADDKKVLFVSEKKAALEVVHKRLTLAKLSDFCLILHNHKAIKREILKSLEDTINLDKVSVKENAIYQLEVLNNERKKLNEYSCQLHTKIMPLNKTIYEVNGILAKLTYAPDVIFLLENVEQTTPEQLRKYLYLISELTKTIGKMTSDYNSNPWKGSNVKYISHELRHNIETYLKKIKLQLPQMTDKIQSDLNSLCIENNLLVGEFEDFIVFLKFCATSPKVPKEWLSNNDIQVLSDKAKELNINRKEYLTLLKELSELYKSDVFDINAKQISFQLSNAFTDMFKLLSSNYNNEKIIFDNADRLISLCQKTNKNFENLLVASGTIAKSLQLKEPVNITEIQKIYEFAEIFNQKIHPKESWFSQDTKKTLLDFLEQAKENQNLLNTLKSEIFEKYEKEILNISFYDMLKRFKTDYISLFKIFNKAYRKDKKEIKSLCIIPVKKISDKDIIELLCKIKIFKEKQQWFKDNEGFFIENFGTLYVGEQTNYLEIEKRFLLLDSVTNYFNGIIPENIKHMLLNHNNYQSFGQEVQAINEIIKLENLMLQNEYQSILSETQNFKDCSLELIIEKNIRIIKLLSDCKKAIQPLFSFAKDNKNYDFHSESLSKLIRLQEIKSDIELNASAFKEELKFFYNGIDTDWEKVLSSLLWTNKLKEYIEHYHLTKDFQYKIISEDLAIKKTYELALYIQSFGNNIFKDIYWFDSLFDEEYSIKKINLYALQDRVQTCLDSLTGLEEWIDFKTAKENCEEEGLSEFINVIIEQNIDKFMIENAFKKYFYRLWLDKVLPNYPAVYSFRSRDQEEKIKQFSNIDKEQMQIASLRIREKLINKLPDFGSITSAYGEVGILKRELGKQKKIMPIRKLFEKIPTLLPCLKPCLMMSPLSVSLFLQSDIYNFDMVIFDEASQVCTENAIGAIMRAKQVIIAGDSKQLPPTNFFNASISDGDYDTEDDEIEDSCSFESVLDEAVTVLPERSLKWHYRSKHEDLIAFSNAKIYNNSLITFPSHIDKGADNGVEYIFVEDGVYDRQGKKNNITEAKKVAKMIFEHITIYPTRSLGVITFSESQKHAVDVAVEELRKQNPQYEEFFREDKKEEFFVKNIETVQGDERDTIIFSIGYAKDANGVMSLNLGPLNKQGGERRLNVAITRAKYNMKLVGSIQPTDIKTEDSNSEGLKLLRSYIEFAITGKSVLVNEITCDKNIHFDSPFEESVYDFLKMKGYRLKTQVGCSGYKIDLAVYHPILDGRFVLGVECDGATYHSSRTARERDRLRQDVLEDIGWRIYRIWSTDWIKDHITEGKKLLDVIEKAIAEYQEENFCMSSYKSKQCIEEFSIDNYLIRENKDIEQTNNNFCFDYYKEVDIFEIKRSSDYFIYICDVFYHIVKNEYPIHFELLCKRIAPLFGNQKSTIKIRREIDYVLQRMSKKVYFKNNYLYLVNGGEIIPRIPKQGELPRPINYICSEELAKAMLVIISKSYGLTKESLYQITSREFGFNRIGNNIVVILDEAFDLNLKLSKIQIIENKLKIFN